jgi:hypothetical protein
MFRFQSNVRPLLYFREETGGRTRREVGDLVEAPALWAEIRREADTFIGSLSHDGSEWTEVSRVTLDLPATLVAGFATAGNDRLPDAAYEAVTARVCQLRIESNDFIRGDCNGVDGVSGDVTDPLFLLQYIFVGGPEPPCLAACDSTGDGRIDISDAIYVLLYNFVGGPPPDGPFPECGSGPLPTDPALGCSSPPESCAAP